MPIFEIICQDCGKTAETLVLSTQDHLVCPACGAIARPHVLWFDECYDEPLFRAESAIRWARDANLLLVVGTAGDGAETDRGLRKALLDAETFHYRGNGAVEVVLDTDFGPLGFAPTGGTPNTTSGEVEKIGMRATLIRTWTGPELVVPNAQLVSSEVLNWNLKRDRKRAEVPVGVAYDSDPEVVAEILTEVAVAHPDVLKHPEPECLFLGFGDSSLNFQVRAWATTDNCFRVQSDLRFAIRKALKDAANEIPFPQRDLHIKTTTDEPPKDA